MESSPSTEDHARSLASAMANCSATPVGEDTEFMSREGELRLGLSLEIREGSHRNVERLQSPHEARGDEREHPCDKCVADPLTVTHLLQSELLVHPR